MENNTDLPETPETEQTIVEHLIELRTRLMRILMGIVLVLLVLLPFSQTIYTMAAQPLIDALPAGSSMIATEVIAPFFVPLKVTLMVAFLVSLPHTLYQLWAFVAPALYQNEKRLILPLIVSSTVLFFIGMAFAYFFVFPAVFHFMEKVTPEGVSMATDIDKYLSFILGMFVAFGVSFEVPVVVVLLHRIGLVSLEKLKLARPYVIVATFAIAAVITPPDILSQTMLAIPMILLYEFGLLACRAARPKSIDSQEENTAS